MGSTKSNSPVHFILLVSSFIIMYIYSILTALTQTIAGCTPDLSLITSTLVTWSKVHSLFVTPHKCTKAFFLSFEVLLSLLGKPSWKALLKSGISALVTLGTW